MKNASKASPWRLRRSVRLLGVVPDDWLENMPGVIEIKPLSAQRWALVYDVRKIQFAEIAAALEVARPAGLCWRWRVGWRQFLDVNIRDSLLAQDGPCCNRPPRQL